MCEIRKCQGDNDNYDYVKCIDMRQYGDLSGGNNADSNRHLGSKIRLLSELCVIAQ